MGGFGGGGGDSGEISGCGEVVDEEGRWVVAWTVVVVGS